LIQQIVLIDDDRPLLPHIWLAKFPLAHWLIWPAWRQTNGLRPASVYRRECAFVWIWLLLLQVGRRNGRPARASSCSVARKMSPKCKQAQVALFALSLSVVQCILWLPDSWGKKRKATKDEELEAKELKQIVSATWESVCQQVTLRRNCRQKVLLQRLSGGEPDERERARLPRGPKQSRLS